MKLNKLELEKCIDILKRGTDKDRDSILSNILIKGNSKSLTMIGSNYHMVIICKFPQDAYKTDQEENFLVHPDINNILNTLDKIESVELEKKDDLILSYGRSKLALEIVNRQDLYPIPKIEHMEKYIKVEGMNFYNMIRGVAVATQMGSEGNAMYRSIHISCKENEFKVEATDGKQIAIQRMNIDASNIAFDAVVDAKQLNEIAGVFKNEDIDINADDRNLCIKSGNTMILVKKIAEQYYDIGSVINKLNPKVRVGINRKELEGILKRALLLRSQHAIIAELQMDVFTGILSFKAEGSQGFIEEKAEIFMEGGSMQIFLDAKRLLDILKALKLENEEFTICFVDSKNPLVIKEDGFCYALLPINKAK